MIQSDVAVVHRQAAVVKPIATGRLGRSVPTHARQPRPRPGSSGVHIGLSTGTRRLPTNVRDLR